MEASSEPLVCTEGGCLIPAGEPFMERETNARQIIQRVMFHLLPVHLLQIHTVSGAHLSQP